MVGLDVNLMFHYQESECSSVASPVSLLLLVPVCLAFVSDSCSYPFFRLGLPLYDSFPFVLYCLAIKHAATQPILEQPGLIVLNASIILYNINL